MLRTQAYYDYSHVRQEFFDEYIAPFQRLALATDARVNELTNQLDEGIKCAEFVLDNRSSGDLAGAVNQLELWLQSVKAF